MDQDEALHRAFLSELEGLEKFRLTYGTMFPRAPLERDDPDVQRLIEAMAYFSARTHLAAKTGVLSATSRLFRQHFNYLLSPVPAMGVLQGRAGRNHEHVVTLPRATEVLLRTAEGTGAARHHRDFYFLTLDELRILPVDLRRIDLFLRAGDRYRMALQFRITHPLDQELGELRLYVNHLGDLLSSLTVLFQLESHLEGAAYSVDRDAADDDPGDGEAVVRFGRAAPPPTEVRPFEHPLQQARQFFHHPESDCFLTIGIPDQRTAMSELVVYLDLSRSWPVGLRLTRDSFRLNAVPIVNLKRDGANPVDHDGTRERHALRHPDAAAGFAVHTVLGAYRNDGDRVVPLRPSALHGGANSFDVDFEFTNDAGRAWIMPNLPRAFEEPKQVLVDAYWFQPELSGIGDTRYEVALVDRYLTGVDWSTVGPIVPEELSPLGNDPEALLRLLALRNQRIIATASDLEFLLEALGARTHPQLATLMSVLDGLRVDTKPYVRGATGFKHVYVVTLGAVDDSALPLVDAFARRLLQLLTAWNTEEVVELRIQIPSIEREMSYGAPGTRRGGA